MTLGLIFQNSVTYKETTFHLPTKNWKPHYIEKMYCGKPRVKVQHLVSAMDFCHNIFSMPQDYLIYLVNQATSFGMQYKWTADCQSLAEGGFPQCCYLLMERPLLLLQLTTVMRPLQIDIHEAGFWGRCQGEFFDIRI